MLPGPARGATVRIAGHNSKNTATGGIAAHLYITSGADTPYTATVTATDGTNTASCEVPVTAYDPAGAQWLCRRKDHVRLGIGNSCTGQR